MIIAKLKQFYLFLESHKPLMLIIAGIVIVVAVLLNETFLMSPNSPLREQDPRSVAFENKNIPTNSGLLTVERVDPPEGERSTINEFELINYYFNKPVDPEQVKFRVTPKADLKIIYDPEYPNLISIYPEKGWQPRILYRVKLVSAGGIKGEVLYDSVDYRYLNTPPRPDTIVLPH